VHLLAQALRGAFFYLFRLNAATWKRVEAMVKDVLPCDFDPHRTIALPIRGSDKCTNGQINFGAWAAGGTSCEIASEVDIG
jgi:hypothetical protein